MGGKHDGPKLPAKQLAILAVARFAEPLGMTSVFPYLPEMIASFGVEEKDVAFWAGITSAAFSVSQGIFAIPWGRASDIYGRKPVICVGLFFTMVTFFIWGMSSSLPMAIVVRALMGGSNGNVGIIRTMVAEMVPEKELQPRAFSIMPLVWSIGSIFGPAFGGLLANPAIQYPGLFGDSFFFKKHPFALPNILGTVIFSISVATAILFLKETLASKRDRRDWGLVVGEHITAPFTKCSSAVRRHYKRTGGSSLRDGISDEESAPFLRSNSRQSYIKQKRSKHMSTTKKNPAPSVTKVFSTQSIIALVAYSILAMHSVAFDQVLPVFLNYPVKPFTPDNTQLPFKFVGGFGFSSGKIGTIFTIYGIVCGAVQFLLFPPICNYFGTRRCFLVSSFTFPLANLIVPFTVLIEDPTGRYAAVLCTMIIKAFGNIFAFPCVTILLTNSASSVTILGTLNGFATLFSAMGRAIGPAMAGALFTWGVKQGTVLPAFWILALIGTVGLIPSFMLKDGTGPSANVREADGNEDDDDEVDESDLLINNSDGEDDYDGDDMDYGYGGTAKNRRLGALYDDERQPISTTETLLGDEDEDDKLGDEDDVLETGSKSGDDSTKTVA